MFLTTFMLEICANHMVFSHRRLRGFIEGAVQEDGPRGTMICHEGFPIGPRTGIFLEAVAKPELSHKIRGFVTTPSVLKLPLPNGETIAVDVDTDLSQGRL